MNYLRANGMVAEKFQTIANNRNGFASALINGAPVRGVSKDKTKPCAIEFRNVHFSFGSQKILDGVSFCVAPGEMKVIMGASGTGKSTIIKLALGLIKPDKGQIFINGEDITAYSENRLFKVRKKIGIVFQHGALFDSLSVYDNVAFRLHEEGVVEEKVEEEVRRMLRYVNLEDAIDMMPDELSGGMRRRVGIARALVGKPQTILFDEPTAGLDPPTARNVCELVIKLRDIERVSSVFVTHRMEILEWLCTEIAERSGDDGGYVIRQIRAFL